MRWGSIILDSLGVLGGIERMSRDLFEVGVEMKESLQNMLILLEYGRRND